MPSIGVDYGLKRVGLAFAGDSPAIAFPGPVLTGSEAALVDKIVQEAESRRADTIVIGLPRNMDDSEGEMSARVRTFADRLGKKTSANIVLWDERLTSVQADRAMLSGNLSRQKRKRRIDSLAAQLLLQNYLDARPQPQEEVNT